MKEPKDIYGRDDLNNLLGMFPEVEKQHFKLWLSSTAILEEVLHSRILNQSRITLKDIKDKARLYVGNRSFNKALVILKDHNYVIIAGIPGIGKTTLAKMLVLHFLRANYDFIDVSYDISEAYSIPDHQRPRVFLYDDFLGRSSLAEKLRKNEDHRLFKFISAVRSTKSAKLILTTREYILRQAQATYEILNSPIFERPQCIVDLSHYTRPIRAQILYNHLYFSSISRSHIEEIVRQTAYLKIIDHPNYNPRIVEYMTDPMWVGCEKSSQYPSVFLRNLQEPFLIWEQAFNNHLTDVARELLLVMGTLPREIFVEDLESAVKKFMSCRKTDITWKEFQQTLSELQGNFIVFRRDREHDIVSFHNPSVHDFIESYLEQTPDLFKALAGGACFFEQVKWVCDKAMMKRRVNEIQEILVARLQETWLAKPCTLINYSSDQGRVNYKGPEPLRHGKRLAFLASLLTKREFSFLVDFFRSALRYLSDQMMSLRLENNDLFYLVEMIETMDCVNDLRDDFLNAAKESLFQNAYWISDVSYIGKFLDMPVQTCTEEDRERITEIISDIVENNLDDDDPEWLNYQLSSLEEIQVVHDLDLERQIESVHDLLSSAERSHPPEEDYDEDRYTGSGSEQYIGNEALADMFSTLVR